MTWIGIEERKPEHIGFVYIILHKETGKYYIGKKQLISNKSRKPLKGNKNKRHYQIESNWEDYWGSSNKFQEYVKQEGKDKFIRIIIGFHNSKFELSYAELYHQIRKQVLFDPLSFNEIINVRLRKMK